MRLVSLLLALVMLEPAAFAQASTVTGSADAASGQQSGQESADFAATQAGEGDASQTGDTPAVFEHPATTRFWLSGQSNIIFQYHPYLSVPSVFPRQVQRGEQPAPRGAARYLACAHALHRI